MCVVVQSDVHFIGGKTETWEGTNIGFKLRLLALYNHSRISQQGVTLCGNRVAWLVIGSL